jgi:signal transduction histidine kinase
VNDKIPKLKTIVLIPLLVMLLLTLLAGGATFQITHAWEKTVGHTTQQVTRALLINNIRLTLEEVRKEAPHNAELARQAWERAKQQVNALSQLTGESNVPLQLRLLLTDDVDLQRLDLLLNQDSMTVSLEQMIGSLQELREYSRSVSFTTTFCMLVLGMILMIVTAIDLSRLIGQLAHSRDLNVSLQENERRRIAQELHDGIIQELVELKRGYSPQKVDQIVDGIRRICHNLKPLMLEDVGLAASLEFLAEDLRKTMHCAVRLSIEENGLNQLPKPYELTLYRIIQELFNNIKKHSRATQVNVTLIYEPKESRLLRLYVKDNGVGFDPRRVRGGMGLVGIRERIQQMGGHLKIDAAVGKGSHCHIFIPVKPEALQDASAAAAQKPAPPKPPATTAPPVTTPAPPKPPATTAPPATTPAPTQPPATTAPPATTPAPTQPPATTAPPATTPAPTQPPATTAPPATTPAPTQPPATTAPPATTPAPTQPPATTAPPEPATPPPANTEPG